MKKIKYISMLLIAICLCAASASAQMLQHQYAIVTTPEAAMVVPLYKEPSQTASVSYSYFQGTLVKVLGDEQAGWREVAIAGVKGYMPSEYLKFVDFAEMDTQLPVLNIKNKTDTGTLNLRERPSLESGIIRQYYNGDQVLVMGVSDEWYHVIGYGNRVGFMKPEFLEATDETGVYMFGEDLLQLRERPGN